jgi:hypothetical protein
MSKTPSTMMTNPFESLDKVQRDASFEYEVIVLDAKLAGTAITRARILLVWAIVALFTFVLILMFMHGGRHG